MRTSVLLRGGMAGTPCSIQPQCTADGICHTAEIGHHRSHAACCHADCTQKWPDHRPHARDQRCHLAAHLQDARCGTHYSRWTGDRGACGVCHAAVDATIDAIAFLGAIRYRGRLAGGVGSSSAVGIADGVGGTGAQVFHHRRTLIFRVGPCTLAERRKRAVQALVPVAQLCLLLGRNRLGKEQCGVCIAFHGVHKALDALYKCLILGFGFIPRCCYTGHGGDCPLIHAERIIQQLFLRARHPRFTLAGNFLDL